MFVIMNKVGAVYERGSQWLEEQHFNTKEEAQEFLAKKGYKPVGGGGNVYHKPATQWLYEKTARIMKLKAHKNSSN